MFQRRYEIQHDASWEIQGHSDGDPAQYTRVPEMMLDIEIANLGDAWLTKKLLDELERPSSSHRITALAEQKGSVLIQ